jgi:predicted metalloprotease
MRLNPFDTGSIKVRGGGGGFPGGGGGQLGCGAIVIALIGALVFGLDPAQMLGTMEGMQQGSPSQVDQPQDEQALCTQNAYATEACNALMNLNQTWEPAFRQAGVAFREPTLHFISGGGVRTGCGAASSAMGPFYCPADETIYIDTAFYDQLDREMGAGGDFARYYVIAHEYGHHIQHLTGIAGQVRSFQQSSPSQANQAQVLMELQADCYAGAWAGKNRDAIEPGDFEEGMTAASAIGDDTLMRRAGREVSPESFTHGTSAQRMQALRLALDSGDDSRCDEIVR